MAPARSSWCGIAVAALERATIDEPADVTALLHPYRLIDELLESAREGLHAELVDEIVADGTRTVLLLVGVLHLAARRPEETYQTLRTTASSHIRQRSAIALLMARMPARADKLDFVVSLLDGIEALPKTDPQDLFLNVADAILMIDGPRGKQLTRSLFDRYARLLPRGTDSGLQHFRGTP
jgi:hypothetical protein